MEMAEGHGLLSSQLAGVSTKEDFLVVRAAGVLLLSFSTMRVPSLCIAMPD